jgi:hypothetical protein
MTHLPDADEARLRMDKIAELLIMQSESKRSRGVLLKLFQAFHSVKNERDRYREQIGEHGMTTMRWADGYLVATVLAIDCYLQARFGVFGVTHDECELIVARKQLAKLFHEFGTTSAVAVGSPH